MVNGELNHQSNKWKNIVCEVWSIIEFFWNQEIELTFYICLCILSMLCECTIVNINLKTKINHDNNFNTINK